MTIKITFHDRAKLATLHTMLQDARFDLEFARMCASEAHRNGSMRYWSKEMQVCKQHKQTLQVIAKELHRLLWLMGKTEVRPA